MEDFKKKNAADMNDKEIVFSQSIKAGKRIYYLDVKKNRKDEMFLAITESKKIALVVLLMTASNRFSTTGSRMNLRMVFMLKSPFWGEA